MKVSRPLLLFTLLAAGFFLFAYSNQQPAKVSAAAMRTLTIKPQDDGATSKSIELATITSSPAGINCGQGNTQCSAQFEEGATVTLTGTVLGNKSDIAFSWHPVNVSYFADFSSPHMHCAGVDKMGNVSGNTCTASMPAADVSIRFSAVYTHSLLTVKKGGTGSGTVANQNPIAPPLLINCGTVCSTDISRSLILFALPDQGSVFAGWDINGGSSADCGPTNYNGKCLASYQVNPRADGATDTFVAIFNKATATTNTNQGANKSTPAAPSVTVKINGKTATNTDKLTLKKGETLTLSGKTIASGTVKIYLFSDPKTYTAIANKDGNWALKITNIPTGNHHIEANVTDLVTHKTSPRTQVLTFAVTNAATLVSTNSKPAKGWSPLQLLTIGLPIVLLSVGLILLYLARRRRLSLRQPDSTPHKVDTEAPNNADETAENKPDNKAL